MKEDTQDNSQIQGIAWYHPAFLVATWFGIGKIPFAPGTWGSLFTFPLFILSHYLLAFASSEAGFINIYLISIAVLFVAGQWATNIYMKRTGRHDPKEVVIDEVVGQMIVLFAAFIAIAPAYNLFANLYGVEGGDAVPPVTIAYITEIFTTQPLNVLYLAGGIPVYFMCFVLFRIFDIWKPWPIKYCDKNIKGGFGVMFDDIFAAVYAVITLYLGGIILFGIIKG